MRTRQFINAAIILLAIICSVPARAHVEGHMPDSVAEMEYRIFLEFKPDDKTTRVKLATVLMNQDKFSEAEEEFLKVLGTSPSDLHAHIGLSRLKLKQSKIPEALAMIRKAAAIAPKSAMVYFYYGLILESDKRPREALQMYQIGLSNLEKDSNDPEYQHDRELLEEAIGKLKNKP